MTPFLTRMKRQAEILAMALHHDDPHTVQELAEWYRCEPLTIKRDLSDIRSLGVDIHSVRNRGVVVERTVPAQILREMFTQYAAISGAPSADRATTLLIKKQGTRAFSNMVVIQRGIDLGRRVRMEYVPEGTTMTVEADIAPYVAFQADHTWRLLAEHEGRMKQYLFAKMSRAKLLERKFRKPSPDEIDEVFRYSWRSWTGPNRIKVRLGFSPEWAKRIKPRPLMEGQVVTQNPDGSAEYELTVNVLEEIAAWIVGRGKGVKVLEPEGLRELVMRTARGAMENYDRVP
jgi:predicted DNA-binding transcriptional regulator YafY